jgi:PAS domain S-box-containing protein
VDEIAPGAVVLLPPAWQYPETACARIVLEGREVTTESFRATRWRQSCDIFVHGERSGIVEVCYLDERPHSDEGPFLKEERDLIKAIAEILGRVVEGKQAEEALRASEANYRAIFSSASDAIVVYDAETARIVDVNPRFCEIFGYTPEEARHLRLEDLGSGEPPYTEEEAVQWVKEAAELEIGPFEFRAKDKAGGPVWVEGSLRLVVIEGREYLLGIGHDITDRKQAEEALQKTREELESRVERGMQRGNPYGLTFRELTVLHLVAAGKADKEIGVELGISPQTASKHLANILSKMGAVSRTAAGVRALREGVVD